MLGRLRKIIYEQGAQTMPRILRHSLGIRILYTWKKNNTNYAIYRYILKCFRNPLAMQIVLGFFNILKI